MTSAPNAVLNLVERFDSQLEAYRSGRYNETQVRRDFIDPLFGALGWDIDNRAGYAEAYRDVIHEAAVKVGGATKAPDYSFRIGGMRKFFVEAKKPSVNIAHDVHPVYQLRRYAWSAKLPLSILTDFEEFAVYDCRIRPKLADKATIARTMYLKYTDYTDKWDDIAAVFSKEAILQGSFDKHVASSKKRGTAEVDGEFLKEIEKWRAALARNIALRNPRLKVRELNFAVQRTIDRIIFLRMAEDRGIERYASLQALISGQKVYPRLMEMFRAADDRYNSGLFHFRENDPGHTGPPDGFTPGLKIDDKVLKDIFRGMYYPTSPYEFSVLPADILGNVYEQFLGKVIILTKGHQARVEEKPEVKKAGGVYYTPKYIVEYIVKHTVGKLLEGKGPREIGGLTEKYRASKARAPLRVLDPACGSGSFLVGAYKFLLDYHRDWYLNPENGGPEAHKDRIYQGGGGQWYLTTAEKKRILLSNIYGVDIDSQAVEVSKLNLLLCMLENENQGTIESQLKIWHERALPDLGDNIKCGNSLIGPDFYQGKQIPLFDEEARHRINAFDWPAEFPKILGPKAGKNPGFDAVIGNPPWGGDIDSQLDYFHAKYPMSTREHTDSFKLFIEAGISLSLAHGVVSMIVPSALLRQNRLKDVRALLLQNSIMSLVDLGEDVFKGVVAPSCIFVVQRSEPIKEQKVRLSDLKRLSASERAEVVGALPCPGVLAPQELFARNSDLEFRPQVYTSRSTLVILADSDELKCKDAGINYQRVKVGMQEKGKSDLAQRLLYEGHRENRSDKMYWKGADIDRYIQAETTDRFCRPNFREFIRSNEVVRLNYDVYNTAPKILLRQTADHIIATIDYKGIWFGRSIIALVPTSRCNHALEYFLGLLNSRYFVWVYHQLVQESGRVFAQVKLSKIKQLPLRTITSSNTSEKAKHDRMVELVETMLKLRKDLPAAKTDHGKTLLKRQIDSTDKQIDQLVYELYGLSEEEIRIVEEADR